MRKKVLSMLLALILCLGAAIPAAGASPIFSDVPAGHWAYDYVENIANLGIIAGVGGGKFEPEKEITVAEFTTMVVKTFYSGQTDSQGAGAFGWWEPFADVANDKGILKGTMAGMTYEKGIWDVTIVEGPMGRYDMAQVMYNTLVERGKTLPSASELDGIEAKIADYNSIPADYRTAVENMYAMGCLAGTDAKGSFSGSETMDRAQACVVLTKLLNEIGDEDNPPVPTEELKVALSDSSLKMETGDTAVLRASVSGGQSVTQRWTTSNSTVVRLTGNGGAIQAVGSGTADVTCTVSDSATGKVESAVCRVTVTEPEQPVTPEEESKTPEEETKTPENGSDVTGDDIQSMREGVLSLVNEERAKEGLSALRLDDELCQVAQLRAEEIVVSFSHTRPDGSSCFTALKEGGISYWTCAENIAAGQATPDAVMNSWMNSSGHKANILNKNMNAIGVGFVKADSGYRYYWVQMFTD